MHRDPLASINIVSFVPISLSEGGKYREFTKSDPKNSSLILLKTESRKSGQDREENFVLKFGKSMFVHTKQAISRAIRVYR